MHSSNPPPLNTSFSSVTPPRRSSSVVFEPYALHILSSVIKDLQFLRQQGYITITALDEIIERLPKPVPSVTPHTPPPALSPTTSPRSKSPAVSVKSDTSQKRISNFITPQRPLSAPSEISPQQEQERSSSHPLAQIEPIVEAEVEEGDQNQQSQQQQQQQQQQTKPLPITFPPPPPIQPQNDQNDQNDQIDQNDDVVNAGQPQLENQSLISKPAVPSRLSVIIPQSNSSTSSSTGTLGTGTTGGTGAILATRPLPLPPNASNSSPPRPQPLPVFNSKQEEAEYEKLMNYQVYKEPMLPALPAYSLSVVEAMWDFMSDDAGDLSFSKGDIIEVVEYVNADWWRGRIQRTNKIGIFPKVYTKIIPEQAMANNGYYSQQRITSQHSNSISAYTSQGILPYVQQSPSLQQQQLPIQQLQQNYTAYQQQQFVNQTTYLNSRSSTNSLNGQQQQFYRNL